MLIGVCGRSPRSWNSSKIALILSHASMFQMYYCCKLGVKYTKNCQSLGDNLHWRPPPLKFLGEASSMLYAYPCLSLYFVTSTTCQRLSCLSPQHNVPGARRKTILTDGPTHGVHSPASRVSQLTWIAGVFTHLGYRCDDSPGIQVSQLAWDAGVLTHLGCRCWLTWDTGVLTHLGYRCVDSPGIQVCYITQKSSIKGSICIFTDKIVYH